MSVLEHIPQDVQAMQKMWELLKPGGRLLLTLPCAAEASEQYIDQDAYGVLEPDEGFFFFQRLYDQYLLEERIFAVAGQPRQRVIYGERSPGTLRRITERRGDLLYPFWREPYMMGQDFGYFKELGELPGEGVIALEFEKSE
jgi:SAM-dependent methyltransferase